MKFHIITVFLIGKLEVEIYMRLAEGYDDQSKIFKLRKAIYGEKQAPMERYKRLTDFPKNKDFHQIKSEQCNFVNGDTILAFFVEDRILIDPEKSKLADFLKRI